MNDLSTTSYDPDISGGADQVLTGWLPPQAPLAMPLQRLERAPVKAQGPFVWLTTLLFPRRHV